MKNAKPVLSEDRSVSEKRAVGQFPDSFLRVCILATLAAHPM
jgi:hypothetical protein